MAVRQAITGAGDLRDAKRLAELEVVIERGKAAFIEVGEALIEVRESRLYRLTYGTFEDYCEKRWALTRNYANRLMSAAKVAEMVPIGTESQARELAPLLRSDGEDAVREAWSEAVARSDGKPTAAVVRQVVAEIIEPQTGETSAAHVEEVPIERDEPEANGLWSALAEVMATTDRLAAFDAAHIAATVPSRRRAATARRIRQQGLVLGRIAMSLERLEG